MYLVEMGVLVFLLFQVYLLANHYAKSYKNLALMNTNLERLVEERSGELIAANEVKDRLLSVMSHDIRSPLNSLRGILQLYNKNSITQAEFSTFANHIENDLGKTTMLVENILYWTASQMKGVQVNKESFDLTLLIEENVQLFETIAANKKIKIQHQSEKGLSVVSDRNIVNLVLRNLLSNAIKFSFEETVITINVHVTSNVVYVQVQDRGMGMDEETQRKIFSAETMGVTTRGTGNEKGTGLGLALCREYLEMTGGNLSVVSVAGKGSIFSIALPVVQ